MIELFRRLFGSGSSDLRRRTVAIYGVLVVANVAAWLWAVALFREQPILLGTALIAYGFGLRHAVDPDDLEILRAIEDQEAILHAPGNRDASCDMSSPIIAGFEP